MKISYLLISLFFLISKAFTQNATITYNGSGLSNINNCAQCCNVFQQSGNNPTVNGYRHYPVSGGAVFDGTNIKMQTQKKIDQQNNIDMSSV